MLSLLLAVFLFYVDELTLNISHPLPLDFSDWIKTNTTRALELQRKDHLLYSLLNGTASASLVADALSGVLSECPTPIEELEEKKRKQRLNG